MPGIFRETTGLWALKNNTRYYFGQTGDVPLPAHYWGARSALTSIFRGNIGLWAIRGVTRVYFGSGSDVPVTR